MYVFTSVFGNLADPKHEAKTENLQTKLYFFKVQHRPVVFTFHKSLTETVVDDSNPSAPHAAAMVAAFEHRFQSTTAIRCPVKGPAQT